MEAEGESGGSGCGPAGDESSSSPTPWRNNKEEGGEGSKINGCGPPPPPPPPMAQALPSRRLNTEIGPREDRGPPSALAGAMMKDKKPFTYTPGGIDLSEIRSPRMAKRLQMNAASEGVAQYNPKPKPNGNNVNVDRPQSPMPPAAMAAMQPQLAFPVFPQGGPAAHALNKSHKPADYAPQQQHQQQQFREKTPEIVVATQQTPTPKRVEPPPPPTPQVVFNSPPPPPPIRDIAPQVVYKPQQQKEEAQMLYNSQPKAQTQTTAPARAMRSPAPSPEATRPQERKTKAQGVGSIYIPPVEQRPSVLTPPSASSSSTPKLNKAPTPWMNSANRPAVESPPYVHNAQGQGPWQGARTIPITIESNQSPTPQSAPQAAPQSKASAAQHLGRVIPIQIQRQQSLKDEQIKEIEKQQQAQLKQQIFPRSIPIRMESSSSSPATEPAPTQSRSLRIIGAAAENGDDEPRFGGSQIFKTLQATLPPQQQIPQPPPQGQGHGHGQGQGQGVVMQRIPPSEQGVGASEPGLYMGANIPSRSFKMLQAMTADPNTSTSSSFSAPCCPSPFDPGYGAWAYWWYWVSCYWAGYDMADVAPPPDIDPQNPPFPPELANYYTNNTNGEESETSTPTSTPTPTPKPEEEEDEEDETETSSSSEEDELSSASVIENKSASVSVSESKREEETSSSSSSSSSEDEDDGNNAVVVRLPLKLSFGKTKSYKDITTVLVGQVEKEDDQGQDVDDEDDDEEPVVSFTLSLSRQHSKEEEKAEDICKVEEKADVDEFVSIDDFWGVEQSKEQEFVPIDDFWGVEKTEEKDVGKGVEDLSQDVAETFDFWGSFADTEKEIEEQGQEIRDLMDNSGTCVTLTLPLQTFTRSQSLDREGISEFNFWDCAPTPSAPNPRGRRLSGAGAFNFEISEDYESDSGMKSDSGTRGRPFSKRNKKYSHFRHRPRSVNSLPFRDHDHGLPPLPFANRKKTTPTPTPIVALPPKEEVEVKAGWSFWEEEDVDVDTCADVQEISPDAEFNLSPFQNQGQYNLENSGGNSDDFQVMGEEDYQNEEFQENPQENQENYEENDEQLENSGKLKNFDAESQYFEKVSYKYYQDDNDDNDDDWDNSKENQEKFEKSEDTYELDPKTESFETFGNEEMENFYHYEQSQENCEENDDDFEKSEEKSQHFNPTPENFETFQKLYQNEENSEETQENEEENQDSENEEYEKDANDETFENANNFEEMEAEQVEVEISEITEVTTTTTTAAPTEETSDSSSKSSGATLKKEPPPNPKPEEQKVVNEVESCPCHKDSEERISRAESLLWRIERFLTQNLALGSDTTNDSHDSGLSGDISRPVSDVDTDPDPDEVEVIALPPAVHFSAPPAPVVMRRPGARSLREVAASNSARRPQSLILPSTFNVVDSEACRPRSNSLERNKRYQRAKTHSRLFQLLQEENDNDEEVFFDCPEPTTTTNTPLHVDVVEERRSRLLPLPLSQLKEDSSPSGSSSGVLSPTSPAARDRLLADIIQEFHSRGRDEDKDSLNKSRVTKKFPSKIFKLLQEEFGEEFYSTFGANEGDFLGENLLKEKQSAAQSLKLPPLPPKRDFRIPKKRTN